MSLNLGKWPVSHARTLVAMITTFTMAVRVGLLPLLCHRRLTGDKPGSRRCQIMWRLLSSKRPGTTRHYRLPMRQERTLG